jgi:hypothetical protein
MVEFPHFSERFLGSRRFCMLFSNFEIPQRYDLEIGGVVWSPRGHREIEKAGLAAKTEEPISRCGD